MLGDLHLKGKLTSETLNSMEGMTCNEVMGAMYAFPRVHLPEKAIKEAEVSRGHGEVIGSWGMRTFAQPITVMV